MTDKKVLTIQDVSCYGQCSLTVALPIISACGVETAILPSAVLSTHTGGFSGFTFRDLTEDIPRIVDHWKKENISFDAVYSGYLGSILQIKYVKEMFASVLKEDGLKIVDPAMADHGRLYTGFDQEFADAMGELCGEGDVILPNITEACFMTHTEYREKHTPGYIGELTEALRKKGAKKIVLKGLDFGDGKIGVMVADGEDERTYFREKISRSSHGTGDCYAAALTGALMQGKGLYESACLATDFVVECLRATIDDEDHWYGVKFERTLPMLVSGINR